METHSPPEISMALFEIKCPQCKGTLWIDPSSGKVVDHQSADHQKGNFEDFLKSRQKGPAWDDRLKKAKDDEAKRKAEIEQKFKQAAKEPQEINPEDAPMKSPFDWD
jgi:Zn-finger nucleic acid-binding protein